MPPKDILPNVFDFTSHQTFLSEFYRLMKAKRRSWSYEVWSQKVKVATGSTLMKITNGQRVPGEKLTQKLSEFYSFSIHEEEYFRLLIGLAKMHIKTDLKEKICHFVKDGLEKL